MAPQTAAEQRFSWCSFHAWPRCSCEARDEAGDEAGRGVQKVLLTCSAQQEADVCYTETRVKSLFVADLCKIYIYHQPNLTMLHDDGYEHHTKGCCLSHLHPRTPSYLFLISSFPSLLGTRRLFHAKPAARCHMAIGMIDSQPALFPLTGAAPGPFVPFSNLSYVTQNDAMGSRLRVAQGSTTT